MTELYRAGAADVGVADVPAHGSELEGLQALVERAQPADVVAVMCHQDRELLDSWLRAHGATVDSPGVLRDKVLAAQADHPSSMLSTTR